MPTDTSQHAGSHARYYPLYHFFALPLIWGAAIVATYEALTSPGRDTIGWAVLTWAIAAAVWASRTMVLTVQDRVIRLEETLRMQRVLPPGMQEDIATLRRRQFVALRFASDEELPDLVRRVTSGELSEPRAIKQAIRSWRPDWFRA